MSIQTYRRLLVVTAVLFYVVIAVSGLVRITGSEMGCPGWPLCQTFLPATPGGWLELLHRLLVLVSGLLIIISGQVAWNKRLDGEIMHDAWKWRPPLVAAVLLVVQALLSALVLWMGQSWLFVVLTVGLQTITLACLLSTIVALTMEDYSRKPSYAGDAVEAARARQFRLVVLGTALASWILVLIGGTVAGTSSGLACVGFPDCNGELIPSSGGLPVVIHMTHRMTAYVVILLMLGIFIYTAVRRWRDYVLLQWVLLTGALLMTQATLGGANSLLAMPLVLRASHLAVAAAYWGSMVIFALLVVRRPVLSGLDSSGRIRQEQSDSESEYPQRRYTS